MNRKVTDLAELPVFCEMQVPIYRGSDGALPGLHQELGNQTFDGLGHVRAILSIGLSHLTIQITPKGAKTWESYNLSMEEIINCAINTIAENRTTLTKET